MPSRSKNSSLAAATIAVAPARTRLNLSATAWLDVVRGNPLNLPAASTSYPQMAKMADDFKEQYELYGKKESTHFSRHYALNAKWLGRIQQKLGSTQQTIHPPPAAPIAGWRLIKRFESYLNAKYPGGQGEERNLAIVKHYATGNEFMGEHNDARSLRGTPVCSLTFGATRKIHLRRAKIKEKQHNRPAFTKKVKADLKTVIAGWDTAASPAPELSASGKMITFSLAHGDIFVMGGRGFQDEFTHELPKEPKIEGGRVGLVIRAREEVPFFAALPKSQTQAKEVRHLSKGSPLKRCRSPGCTNSSISKRPK